MLCLLVIFAEFSYERAESTSANRDDCRRLRYVKNVLMNGPAGMLQPVAVLSRQRSKFIRVSGLNENQIGYKCVWLSDNSENVGDPPLVRGFARFVVNPVSSSIERFQPSFHLNQIWLALGKTLNRRFKEWI